LFGDGAGAMILEGVSNESEKRGILFTRIYSDGRYADILNTTGGIATTRTAGFVTMNGKEVFRHAVAKMSSIVNEGLAASQLAQSDVDWVVPHQANTRILQAVARQLGMADEKFISTVAMHANTSAASIPLAIAQAASEKKLKQGQLLVIPALGAGLTWGACILRW
jgi:3-oxoacyl-[acyl-carrier-protein] synthase-3